MSHVELSRFRAQNPSSGIFPSPVLSRLYHCYYCYARSPSDSLESMATLQLDVQQTSGACDTLATSNSTAVFIWSKLSRRLLSLSPPSFSHIIIALISAEQRRENIGAQFAQLKPTRPDKLDIRTNLPHLVGKDPRPGSATLQWSLHPPTLPLSSSASSRPAAR